jgi:hypothetical protein
MGMFDRCLHDGKEIQFKAYVGSFQPNDREVKLGEVLEDFPKIPVYEIDGISRDSEYILRFECGVLVSIKPMTDDWYKTRPIGPIGRNTMRRMKARVEECSRMFRSSLENHHIGDEPQKSWQTLGAVIGDMIMETMDRPSFTEFLFQDSKYPNHSKRSGKWRRLRKL